jgi:hypothetical protein
MAPKALFIFRTTEPRSKRSTGAYTIASAKHQVEALGVGNQFVAYGVHPETRRDYEWFDGSPAEISLKELPTISPEQVDAILSQAEEYFAAHGTLISPAKVVRDSTPREAGEHPWSEINAKALANLNAWVGDLGLEDMKRYDAGYHSIASYRASVNGRQQRGRALSLQPVGIYDHSAKCGMSPIDLVSACLTLSPGEAVGWLEERLGIAAPRVDISRLLAKHHGRHHTG